MVQKNGCHQHQHYRLACTSMLSESCWGRKWTRWFCWKMAC